MTSYEITSIAITSAALVVSSIAAFFTFKNLREIRKQFFEQNRGHLVFYIDTSEEQRHMFANLIVKNFGNSPAKLIDLQIDPPLEWGKSKCKTMPNQFNIANCKNVFLAPGKYIKSVFDFHSYPDNKFNIQIQYETSGQILSESYVIDLHFTEHLAYTKQGVKTVQEGLKQINDSIQSIADKFE